MTLEQLTRLNHRMWVDLATREVVERHKITILLLDNASDGMFCLHTASTVVVLMMVNNIYNPVQFGKQYTLSTSKIHSFQHVVEQSQLQQTCAPSNVIKFF